MYHILAATCTTIQSNTYMTSIHAISSLSTPNEMLPEDNKKSHAPTRCIGSNARKCKLDYDKTEGRMTHWLAFDTTARPLT
jgi:hypothetical protein